MHHCCLKLALWSRFWKTANVLRCAKDHFEIRTVVSAARWVKPKVIPISKVTKSPHRDIVSDTIARLEGNRTGKVLIVEIDPLGFGQDVAL